MDQEGLVLDRDVPGNESIIFEYSAEHDVGRFAVLDSSEVLQPIVARFASMDAVLD